MHINVPYLPISLTTAVIPFLASKDNKKKQQQKKRENYFFFFYKLFFFQLKQETYEGSMENNTYNLMQIEYMSITS